eukprot:CAMPEP_0195519122 /NCGR_PEP_ID=MMETSP0794_2-20130614/14409_1 /TAXON_ID=515487 /ORGANISM="Stephanopyxis turris, Strain CCMP 815" /LENGTH=551 /DNA_ID=CAMNT_0040648229 /DNA_START=131 /DNA_END=1786 /DNA_ORIENTATION=-
MSSQNPTYRFLSTSSQYEYPLRTETPVVTRSKASDIQTSSPSDEGQVAPRMNDITRIHPGAVDHFDDKMSMDRASIDKLREEQHKNLVKPLNNEFKIQPIVPSYIPQNLPAEQLEIPQTEVSTLSNGLRVASQETYGQVATIGILANVGSRLETDANTGVNHLMELLAFQSTYQHSSAAEIVSRMDTLGGSTFAAFSREQMMYCVDILRPNIDEATELLAGTVLTPKILDEEVEEMKRVIEYQTMDMLPEMMLGEGMQIAAYRDQQLGRPHFCPLEALPNLNAQTVQEFRAQHLSASDMVLAGAGIEHERLVELGEKYFSDLPPTDPSVHANMIKPSTYSGGEHRLQTQTVDGHTRVALAFELGGWHSDDLVPTCVLQILLGGGNSFSAGGPGKGMYSRLYREVLNRFYWAESTEAFTSFHSESGLLGISGSSTPNKSRDMTRIIAEHLGKLTADLVTDEEIDRARNMLKCNVLTQLESRLVLFEDIGRQILTYGEREDTTAMCAKIDKVTADDLRNLARRALSNPPTISSAGDDISNVPTYCEVSGWFKP